MTRNHFWIIGSSALHNPLSVFSVDEGKSPVIPYVYVNSSGIVKNYKPIQVVSACDLEIYAFPFDKQNCTLTFRSLLHSGKTLLYTRAVICLTTVYCILFAYVVWH